jgi:beta-glucanase (GH16 family)
VAAAFLLVAPPADARLRDSDRDGLSNRFEKRRSFTSPQRPDTDRDRLRDGFEVQTSRTDPRRKDTDGDGLTDRAELRQYKTNPRLFDTDGDGMGDGLEVMLGRNPLRPEPATPPPDTAAPSAPTGLRVTSSTAASLTVSWAPSTDNVGVTGYRYFLGSNYVGTTTSTSAVISGLTCGTTYTLGVSAFDAAGNTSTRPTTSGTTAACPPPPSPGGPGPIAGMGYRQTFRDEFDSLNRAVWDDHIWYEGASAATSQYVQDGVLNLVARRSQGYQKTTVTTQKAGLTYKYGYFEGRMRWTKGAGSWPGFWLYSYRHATNPSWPSVNPECSRLGEPVAQCYAGELDIFEGQGRAPNVFYGTLHRNSCSCYGVGNQQTSPNTTNVGRDMTVDFHTYGMLWTPTRVTWFLDGAPLHSANPYDSLNQPMFVLLQMWIGGWTGATDSSTPDELRTEVDWVRVWQK